MRATSRSGSRIECVDDSLSRHFVTARQLPILLSLANDERTVRTIAYDWPGLSDGAARSIVAALYRKGLVEPCRFEPNGRSWKLSRDGGEFVTAIERVGWADDEEE